MAPPSRDSGPDPKPVSNNNAGVVFIDTNLDTHLAVIVSDNDTVSDLKKRILSEHPLCFPKIGQIQIHAMKVKRKGYFYHLSDSMFVKSAFYGFNKSWFLSVDASPLVELGQNELLCSSGSPNQLACLGNANNALIGPVDIAINDEKEECTFVNPPLSKHTGNEAGKKLETGVNSSGNNDIGVLLPGSIPEMQDHCNVNHELPRVQIECEVDGSSKGVKDDHNVCEEVSSISVPSAKKRRKSKSKKEDTVQDSTSKGKVAFDDNLLTFAPKEVSLNGFQAPQLENKQDEKSEVPFGSPYVSEDIGKELGKNLETGVNSFGNNDPGIPLPGSIPETQDHCCLNHELPSSHIECEADGSSKGGNDDRVVCEDGTSKSVPSAKEKQKSKRKKEDTVQYDTSKENDACVFGPGNDAVQQDIAVITNPSDNADKEVIKETEVLKEHQHTECNNNNMKNDIDAESMKEPSEPAHATNKKHRKRKRSLTHDSEERLKVETIPQKVEAQKSDEACKERKEPKDQLEFNNDISRYEVEHKHDTVAEVVSDIKPSTKKKQKGKEKSGDKSLSEKNWSMNSDFNIDNVSNQFLEVQWKIKNSSADQLAENLNDTDPIRTTEHGGRRKGKKKSSNPHETHVFTSSRKDDEADRSSIQGKGVQEEISEDGLISKDASKEGIPSKVNKTGNCKNHRDIDIKVHPSDVNEPKELTEDNVNIVLDQCHKSGAGWTEGDEEGREVLPQNDPEPMLLEDCTPSNQGNTEANIKELNVTLEVVDMNGMAEPVKSEKKKRRKRKAKDSDAGATLREGVGPVASESETVIMKSLKSTNCDPASGNIGTEENPSNHTEGKTIQQEMKGTVLSATAVNEPNELTEDNVNIVLDQFHKSEAGRIEGAEEGREVLPQNDPKPMLLEECTPSNQDNTDANIKELNVTSKVADMNRRAEPVKSEKKKRRTRKAKDSDGGATPREGIGPEDASESETVIVKSLKSTNCDHASGNTGTEENPLNHTEGKNTQQEETKGIVPSAIYKEDDFRADNAGSLEQIKTTANTKHLDKTQRKKSNNKQTSTSISNMLTKDEVLDSKKPSPSSDSGTHASPSSKITKKSKSASTKSINKSSKTNLEPVKDTVGLQPSDSRFMSGSNGEQEDNNLEAPLKNYKINADQQFPSQQLQRIANMTDDILVDEINGSVRKDLDPMTGQNAQRREATKGQTLAESLSSSRQLSPRKERDVRRIHPGKKVPNVDKTERDAKLSSRSNSDISSIRENRKPQVNASGKSMVLVKQREGLPISSSISKKMVQKKEGKASGNNVRGVVGKTQQKKSLLAGTIFKDDSSGTSEDVDEVDKSDASTRTPSDNSLLSDFSDGDSIAGSYGRKRLENGERSALKASMSSTKGMSIDHILRSSSRYKKAKITASQLEGTESQPEFVPDSLADM